MKKTLMILALVGSSLVANAENRCVTRPVVCMNETVVGQPVCDNGTCTVLIRGTTCFEVPENPAGYYTPVSGPQYYTKTWDYVD